MDLSLIVAHDLNRGIGLQGKLPWYIPKDLQWFKKNTLNKPIIMGRNTWDSLPIQPLPNRPNIVITSKPLKAKDITSFSNLYTTMEYVSSLNCKEAVVIGGASLYNQLVDSCNKLYITKVNLRAKCDTFFPEINEDNYNLDYREYYYPTEIHEVRIPLEFSIFSKKR
jgi:dihydrofolate reductase